MIIYQKMKNTRFLILLCLISAISYGGDSGIRITVTNPSQLERQNAIVSIMWQDLRLPVGSADSNVIVIDKTTQREVTSQAVDENCDGIPENLLFMSNFKPGEEKWFSVETHKGKIAAQSYVNAKYPLPRKDVAWENDRIAYRIYGSPLAGDVFNGIDVLVKRVRYQIIDKWYEGDSLKGKERVSYHVDHGEGADFFLVGKTLGCGGTAILLDGKVYQAGLFSYYRIIANGPLRTIFEVYYPGIDVGGEKYLEIKKFTLDAGSNLNKIENVIIAAASGLPVNLVCGLVKRNGVSVHKIGKDGGISVWGPTDADPVNEFLGTGIVIPDKRLLRVYEDSVQVYAVCSAKTGAPFTYYTGAGWTRSGDFKNMEEWNQYLENYLNNLESPLIIEIKE